MHIKICLNRSELFRYIYSGDISISVLYKSLGGAFRVFVRGYALLMIIKIAACLREDLIYGWSIFTIKRDGKRRKRKIHGRIETCNDDKLSEEL